jgi:hypothetical protein
MGDDKLPTQDADALGEMPDAETEPREPNPGGADALPQEDETTAADLDPDKNPAIEPAAPGVLKEGEDTDTQATKDGDDVAPEDESPA